VLLLGAWAVPSKQDEVDTLNAPRGGVHHPVTTLPAHSRADSFSRRRATRSFTRTIGQRQTDRTSAASLPACPAYADVSEKIVSRNPLGSLTSNARLFHSVS